MKRPPVLIALALVVCVGGLVFAYANCVFGCVGNDEAWESASRELQSRKEKSFTAWEDQFIGDEKARKYVLSRIALLVVGEGAITFENVENDRNRTKIMVKKDGDEDSIDGKGTATAITSDGYFLTAAHNLLEESLNLVVNEGNSLKASRVRVVWAGSPEGLIEPDLALIHLPLPSSHLLARHFPLENAEEIFDGSQIVSAGYGEGNQSLAGGRILGHIPWKVSESGARWMEWHHDSPFARGDSGGPLISADGGLLGINTSMFNGRFRRILGRDFLFMYRIRAIAPDPEWIRELIAEDRARSQ